MLVRRLLLGASGILLVWTTASFVAVRWAWVTREMCPQPCQDLGLEVLKPAQMQGMTVMKGAVHRPACSPLKLDLELHRPVTRRDTRYTLWYRARLTNQSCFAFDVASSMLLLSPDHLRETSFNEIGFFFEVLGPDGAKVPQGGFSPSSRYDFLYRLDEEAYRKARAFVDSRIGEQGNLRPGESIETVPTVLDPHEKQVVTQVTGPHHAHRLVPVAPPPGAEQGPPGFKVLDTYIFRKKGTYRIKAVYRGEAGAIPYFNKSRQIPDWLRLPHSLLSYHLGISAFKRTAYDAQSYEDYNLDVASPELPFIVE